MQLARIEVRNIRSYESARLDLTSGTTLLVGDVGSGKTSLLFAVEMALFGTAEIDATYLVRHGGTEARVLVALEENGHRYEIERGFRRVRRKGRESLEPGRLVYREDGATTAYSATELRQRVISLLGFRDNPNPRAHSDLWRWAVYVPQERMREILSAAPLERLETVRKALGVERYRLAGDNAKEVARDLRRSAVTLRAQVTSLKEYADDRDSASEELRRIEEARNGVDSGLERAAAELDAARERVRTLELRTHSFDVARQRLDDLALEERRDRELADASDRRQVARTAEGARLGTERDAVDRLAQDEGPRKVALVAAEAELTQRRTEAERAAVGEARYAAARELELGRHRELDLARGELGLARQAHGQAEAALKVAAPRGDEPEPSSPTSSTLRDLDALLTDLRRRERSAGELAALARRTTQELDELTAEGTCPRCHQSVRAAEFARHVEEAHAALSRAESELRAASATRERSERERRAREEYDSQHARWVEARARTAAAREALQRAVDAVRRAEARTGSAEESWERSRAETSQLEGPARAGPAARAGVAAATERAEAARVRHDESRRAIDRRSHLAEQVRRLAEEEERAHEESAEARRRQVSRESMVRELNESLVSESDDRAEERTARAALASREQERHRLAEERGRLSGMRDATTTRLERAEAAHRERERLTHLAETVESKAEWLTYAFHDAVITMERRVLEHAQVEFERTFRTYFAALVDDPDLVAVTDPTFSPSAEIRGVATPPEALSGGERTSLALAYRLALARVVRSLGDLRLDTLLLDEPTDGFSPEQVQSMGALLEELRLPQVVLVSHERELEAIADRVVRVEKVDGVSTLADGSGASEAPAT